MKPSNKLLYVHQHINHPPALLKKIPENINKRLKSIASSQTVYDDAIPIPRNHPLHKHLNSATPACQTGNPSSHHITKPYSTITPQYSNLAVPKNVIVERKMNAPSRKIPGNKCDLLSNCTNRNNITNLRGTCN